MKKENTSILMRTGYIILALAILCELIILYKGIFNWMQTAWFTYPPDRFGVYIPVMFLSLFIYRLLRNPSLKFKSYQGGLYVILGGAIIFIIGYLSDIHLIQAASLIVTCYGMVLYLMGTEWGKIMFFPFSFLFLMLPTTSSLVESVFSVPLRNFTAYISCKILNSTGSACDTINCVLYIFDTELPVQYYRDAISSPLMHLILTFIAAEIILLKNRSKLIFLFLLWIPYVIISHSILYLFMGWSHASGTFDLSETIWESRKWFPVAIHILLLIVSWAFISKILRRVNNVGK